VNGGTNPADNPGYQDMARINEASARIRSLRAAAIAQWYADRDALLHDIEDDNYGVDDEILNAWDLIDRAQAFFVQMGFGAA
jgi:hypothetical protein